MAKIGGGAKDEAAHIANMRNESAESEEIPRRWLVMVGLYALLLAKPHPNTGGDVL